MKHIEELPFDQFLELVSNIHCWYPTVKIDGTCAINFGYDDFGLFYTVFGRDFKNIPIEQRKYSTEDWLKRNIIMNNPGAFAHAVLEKCQYILRPKLKNNEPVVAEILFQSQPNCIQYNLLANQIIILNNHSLGSLLKNIAGEILLPQIYIEGINLRRADKVHLPYQFSQIPKIDPYLFNIQNEVDSLNKYLAKSIDGLSHKEICLARITNKNRELVVGIRSEIEKLKSLIKDKLIEDFNNIDYTIKPKNGYTHEGFVIRYKNYLVKVIDKETFTKYHKINWCPAHDAKKIRVEISRGEILIKDGLIRLQKMIDDFDTLYPDISQDIKEHMKNQVIMAFIDIKRKE